MTRIEKYDSLRQQIMKDNAQIKEQEQKIEKYRHQLLEVDKQYFEPIFKDLNHSLNLINFENSMVKSNHEYLSINDKYLLIKMITEINDIFEHYSASIKKQSIEEENLIPSNLEYLTVIDSMRQKISDFQSKLESKIIDVKNFVSNLEEKFKNYKTGSNNFNSNLNDLQQQNSAFQEDLQQLKIKIKTNNKLSLIFFSIIIISLILVVGLLLLVVLAV